MHACRAIKIYMAYKSAQTRALVLRGAGWGPEQVEAKIWQPHHQWAGKAMYQLCIDLRGFYLKVCLLERVQPGPPCNSPIAAGGMAVLEPPG